MILKMLLSKGIGLKSYTFDGAAILGINTTWE